MAGNRIEKTFRESVKKMSADELGIELKRLQDKHFTLRTQQVTEKVEDNSQFGQTKRNIARVKTEMASRASKNAPAKPAKTRAPKAAPAKAAKPAKTTKARTTKAK